MNARGLTAALIIFAVIAGGIGVTVALLAGNDASPPAASKPPPTPAAPPRPQMPTAAEFQVGVVVTEQNCSGSAGCVYKYRIEPKYTGLHPLPEKEITVSYQVTGGHQPQMGEFTVQNGQARVLQDVPLQGPPGARLQASVTQIR